MARLLRNFLLQVIKIHIDNILLHYVSARIMFLLQQGTDR